MFCSKCGKELGEEYTFCPNCGERINIRTEKKDNTSVANNTTSATVTKNINRKKGDSKKAIIVLTVITVIIVLLVIILFVTFMNILNKENVEEIDENFENIKQNQDEKLITFNGGFVTEDEFKVYYSLFYPYLKDSGYDDEVIIDELVIKIVSDKMALNEAIKNNVELSQEEIDEIETTFNDEDYVNYFLDNYNIDLEVLKDVYYNDYLIKTYVEEFEINIDELYDNLIKKSNYKVDQIKLEKLLNNI